MAIDLGDAQIVIKVDDKGANKKFDALESRMGKMSKTFKKVGLAMMGAGVLVGGGLIALGKGAVDFEMAMRKVNTMAELTEEGFRSLSEAVKDVSSEVGISSVELAAALYQIISAGVPAADAIDVLALSAKAAVAGLTDTLTVADGLTTVLNAFKIPATEAARVLDVLFTVSKKGKTDIGELSAFLFQVAPVAAAADVKFEEVAAALATVTKQGTPLQVAATQIRQAIVAFIKPSADMTSAVRELGYESALTMLKELGLAGSLNLLSEHVGGALEPLGKMFTDVSALGAVLSLTGENSETFAEDIKATSEDAAGAVDKAYGEMNKSVARQFEILFNDIKLMGDEIGETLLPIFKEIIEKMKPIVEQFRNWVEANKDLFPTLFKLAGVLIGAGGVLFAISQIVHVIHAVNMALAIFHALSGPAGWAKLAVGMLIAGGAIWGLSQLMGDISFKKPVIWEGEGPPPPPKPGEYYVEPPEGWEPPPPAPPLPSMARGGIVPGPLGKPIPIIAHGGEPFGGVGGRMGDTINVYPQNLIGTQEELVAMLRREFILIKDRDTTTGF